MSNTIRRELQIPQPREQVWQAITDRATLAEWMFPNDFEPRVGHRFTFRVPGNPKMNFDGLTVRCEVLECQSPTLLVFSWSAGGAVENTRVSFRLEPAGDGTRLLFEHTGFDLSIPFGEHAFKGAEYGWAKMLKQLSTVLTDEPRTLRAARVLDADTKTVFTAFENAAQLAKWWGPEGFTNTFAQCDFTPGGRWVFVMHGPNGTDYANECVFREIERDARVVIDHVVQPIFTLTIVLAPIDGRTHLLWTQTFESAEFATNARAFLTTANQQNLDRLQALLAGEKARP